MKWIRASLIMFAAAVCAFSVQAQTAPTTELAQSKSRDFAADRWSHFTAAFRAYAGVTGESDADDLLLLACTERDRSVALSFHPADQPGLTERADLTLAFDGGTSVDAEMHAVKTIGKDINFLLLDRDPNFRPVMERLMSSKTVEFAIVQSDTVETHHTFTLNGAAEAIAPVLKLCGQ